MNDLITQFTRLCILICRIILIRELSTIGTNYRKQPVIPIKTFPLSRINRESLAFSIKPIHGLINDYNTFPPFFDLTIRSHLSFEVLPS